MLIWDAFLVNYHNDLKKILKTGINYIMTCEGEIKNMKDYWKEPNQKQISKKKIIISIIVAIVVVIIITIIALYKTNRNVMEWIDKNIFRKEVMQDRVNMIELKEENSNIYAFSKYIGILSKNQFIIYNNTGNQESNLEYQILLSVQQIDF